MGTQLDALQEPGTRSYLELPFYHSIDGFWQVVTLLGPPQSALIVTSLALRYRRGGEPNAGSCSGWCWGHRGVRANLQRYVTGDGPILLLLSFQLIPAAVAIAIVRYQLFDIRLVVSRTVLYLLLTLGVIAAYVALVAGLDAVLRRGAGSSVLATMAIAVAFNPVRLRLQRLVDRLLYGDRADPVRAMSRVGDGWSPATGRTGGWSWTRSGTRCGCRTRRSRPTSGCWPSPAAAGEVHAVPLRIGAEDLGELVVGVRSGETPARRGRPAGAGAGGRPARAGVAVGVARGRGEGLPGTDRGRAGGGTPPAPPGPARRHRADPDRRRLQAGRGPQRAARGPGPGGRHADRTAGRDRAALDDVRRVVHGLRPPSLDELGLAGALRQQAAQLALRHDGAPMTVAVLAPAPMPELPAAVEVAAYRIAVEGLTNVARHSSATGAEVRLAVLDGALHVDVTDDGAPNGAWRTGVGLTSMRERAAEVGGVCDAGPVTGGGRVHAVLPT